MDREMKICAVVNRLAQGYADKEIIYELEIPRRTYFYWKNRIEKEGHSSVIKKKATGPKSEIIIDKASREKILSWRDKYGWSPVKIEKHLLVHYRQKISHRQIYYLFQETDRNKPIDYERRLKGRTRFERTHSNSLLHTDWKDILTEPMLTILDDHSRFIPASKKYSEATMENGIRLLEFVIRKFGKPEQVITDRGTQFWNNRSDKPTEFTTFCIDNGIVHIKCSKKSPQANGKLENFHGQYDAESWRFKTHEKYIRHWNYERPHGAIGYLYPAEVFFRDMKSASNP